MLTKKLAAWNGSGWSGAGTGVEGIGVYALANYGGDLIVGGEFTAVNSVTALNLAYSMVFTWAEFGGGANGGVLAFQDYDGDLMTGGLFTTLGATPHNQIAAWGGSSWSALGTGIGGGGVLGFGAWQGDLIVAGLFSSMDGESAENVATWDGANAGRLGTGMNNAVYDAESLATNLWAGGSFTIAGGKASSHIAVREPEATLAVRWVPVVPGCRCPRFARTPHGPRSPSICACRSPAAYRPT